MERVLRAPRELRVLDRPDGMLRTPPPSRAHGDLSRARGGLSNYGTARAACQHATHHPSPHLLSWAQCPRARTAARRFAVERLHEHSTRSAGPTTFFANSISVHFGGGGAGDLRTSPGGRRDDRGAHFVRGNI